MDNLVKIATKPIGSTYVQTVNARDLHAFLGVVKDFSDWIKVQIDRARLINGKHYCTQVVVSIVNPQKGEKENLRRGRPIIEYFLTLDAGKHVAMMSGTDKGFEVRDYFIECERRALEAPVAMDLRDPKQLVAAALQLVGINQELQAKIEVLQPQADALARIAGVTDSVCVRDAANLLQVGPKELTMWMQARRWLYRNNGARREWRGYRTHLIAGLLEHKIATVERPDGTTKLVEQVRVTGKGLTKLAVMLLNRPLPA